MTFDENLDQIGELQDTFLTQLQQLYGELDEFQTEDQDGTLEFTQEQYDQISQSMYDFYEIIGAWIE